jgi:hypothetical protein
MDLIKRSILASAIMTLMLASAMPLLLMPTLQPVEGQFLGDDDSALLPGFDDTTTTNNERLQLDLSATSNNNTLLRENEKTIRFYAVPLLREAIEDRVGEGNTDDVRFVIVGLGSNHTTVGINDTVSLIRSEFNSLSKTSGNSTTAGVQITLDSSQCSSPSPNLANAGECQFTITATTMTAAEGMDSDGLQLDLSATSNNNTLLRENEKTIRFYVAPLLREAIEDRVGEGNTDNVRIVIVGPDSNHTTVGTNDAVSLIRSEFNSLSKTSGNSTGFEITLDSSQCSSPSPNLANAGECQFTIRLAQKAAEAADAAGGITTIRPPEESGTIGLNDESEQVSTSDNSDDNSSSNSSSSSSDDNNDGSDDGEDCDESYPDVCIPSPPPVLECSDIDEEDFEVRGSDPHGFDSNDDGVGCEEDGSSSSSSSSSSSDEIDRNSISNFLTNKLDDIFGDRLVIAADRMNSVLDRIAEDKAQIRQTIEQIAERIAGATDTD